MKPWEISIVVICYCVIGGACIGAFTPWNDSGGCMAHSPIFGMIYTIVYGIGGFIVGVVLSPVAVFTNATVQKRYSLHKSRQVPSNSQEANSLLLRPASTVAVASQTLLRPSQGRTETDPASLLRATDKADSKERNQLDSVSIGVSCIEKPYLTTRNIKKWTGLKW